MPEETNYKRIAQEICGDAEKIEKLLKEIHELKRTRSEAEAAAKVQGYREGQEDVKRQLAALNIKVA